LRRQRELEQQSQPSIVPLHSDFDSEIEDIVAANERHQQAFAEIDTIANQLPPRELLRLYQQAQMREMGRRAMAERETALRAAEAREVIGLYCYGYMSGTMDVPWPRGSSCVNRCLR